MELTQALDTLRTTIATKQKEIDILNLAISALEQTFAPELQVLENARQTISQKTTEIEEKNAIIAEKDKTLEALLEEKELLINQVAEITG